MDFVAVQRHVGISHTQGVIEQAIAGDDALWFDKGFGGGAAAVTPSATRHQC